MRVLMVGNLYPPHHFGGYELGWQRAVEHLRSGGHEVHVLAADFRKPEVADDEDPDVERTLRWYSTGYEFVRLPLRERLATERHNHAVLQRQLEQFTPDVISFWAMGGMSHSLIEAVRRRGYPMAAFMHDQWLDYGRFTDQWLRLFYRRSSWPLKVGLQRLSGVPTWVDYGSAGRYVFISEFTRQRALALGLGLSDTAVAQSGIDPLFLQPEHDPPWRWRLLFAGRLHPEKGIYRALLTLHHTPQATLTIAGAWDPREERALADKVAAEGLTERVRILGQVPAARLVELYRQHDALLFPILWDEPWGLVPLEAMAAGIPVVGTARGGSREYLRHGENCLLVDDPLPERLASAVEQLAVDAELRRRLRAGGRTTAAGHTAERFTRQVEEHLLAVLGRS